MTLHFFPSRSLFVLLALAVTASLHAQSGATPPALGLLRLKSATRPNDTAPLAVGKFNVDELFPAGAAGASKGKRDNVDVLALDDGREWARALRGNGKDVMFVSFQVHASQTTIIDIAGVRLGITEGAVPAALQLMYDDSATGALQWKPLQFHAGTGVYAGRALAALPTLTVRLDPDTGTWDLFVGSRLIADHLPLIAAKRDDRQFRLRAGGEGAWLTGLVMSDENPLFEDANGNGVDDAFERQSRGALLAASAGIADKKRLAQDWKEAQRRRAPPALYVQRPKADAPAVPAPRS